MAKQRRTSSKSLKKEPSSKSMPSFIARRLSEGAVILVITLSLFLMLALSGYQNTTSQEAAQILGGKLGYMVSDALFWLFGYIAYLVPWALSFMAVGAHLDYREIGSVKREVWYLRCAGSFLTLVGGTGLLTLVIYPSAEFEDYVAGGVIGRFFADSLSLIIGPEAAVLISTGLVILGLAWLTAIPWVKLTDNLGQAIVHFARWLFATKEASHSSVDNSTPSIELPTTNIEATTPKIIEEEYNLPLAIAPSRSIASKEVKQEKSEPALFSAEVFIEAKAPENVKPSRKAKHDTTKTNLTGMMPPLSLLERGAPSKSTGGYSPQVLEHLSRQVEQHLLDFGIQADVVAVHPGPVITRFELQLAAGIKVSKLTGLAKDLARSLSVVSVRVVEVIPGKTVVGLELPNQHREVVRFGDVLSHEIFQKTHSTLPLALGVDIAGHPMVVDLAKMPHLLVAGTTGSGKSVGINAMILSLLFKASPDEVRLIMIDPKMLELSVYDGIPHLLTPVVTDMKEAASALRWCVAEMERRYRLMAQMGVRNLAGFNAKILEARSHGEEIPDPFWKAVDGLADEPPVLDTLPNIVVIIDELADMMMVVGKKVEQLIARIAQKARAAGIHLVLATQRPSVDVLTGLIKSNIPTRISFQVSSKIDSRTILDQQGAEQLLGHGDMLYLAPGTGAPLRVHGAFVDDQEVHKVANEWRSKGAPNYIEEITAYSSEPGEPGFDEEGGDTEDSDPLYDQAVEFIVQTRKASVSSVQRRFKIGYNRAARLVDEMERTGIVGPLEGGYRDVLISHAVED